MSIYPYFSKALVMSVDPHAHGVYVTLASGQQPALPLKVLQQDASSASVKHGVLPRPGTWGLVCFPGGDSRSGVWLGATYLAQQNAYTTETDPNVEYNLHPSGAFEWMDGNGQWAKEFPDGTFITCGTTGAKPTLNRHIVNPDQTQSFENLPDATRVPNPPSPFIFTISHPSGVTIEINAGTVAITGNVTIAGSLTVTGDITAGQGDQNISSINHLHTNVSTGTANSGPPKTGT